MCIVKLSVFYGLLAANDFEHEGYLACSDYGKHFKYIWFATW